MLPHGFRGVALDYDCNAALTFPRAGPCATSVSAVDGLAETIHEPASDAAAAAGTGLASVAPAGLRLPNQIQMPRSGA